MIKLPEIRKPYFVIVQLGAGGNGGYILQQMAQIMNIFGTKGRYIIADPDIVESKNLGNQLFIEKDISRHKAEVLARRYSSHYNIQISSYSAGYVEDESMLDTLFNQILSYQDIAYLCYIVPVLIGCVDNNYTRQIMHRYFMNAERLIYIDVGIEGAKVPQDGRRNDQWTDQEKAEYMKSGWVGQVVCGLRWNGETILPPVCDVYPDMLEDVDPIAPSDMACSQIVVNEPQRLLTNKFAALEVVSYFNELFSESSISNHMSYVTLKSKVKVRSQRVEKDLQLEIR